MTKKKIEKLTLGEFSGKDVNGQTLTVIIAKIGIKINELVGSHNESVEEAILGGADLYASKRQPTTPEKKCCDSVEKAERIQGEIYVMISEVEKAKDDVDLVVSKKLKSIKEKKCPMENPNDCDNPLCHQVQSKK